MFDSRQLPIAAAIICLSVNAAHAEIYKCTDADGNIAYSQTPCPKQKTEAIRTGSSSSGTVDCAHAGKFAFASARLMQGGLSSYDLFNRYGGVDSLSKGSIGIINYVYGFRTNPDISAERIASLTQAKCKARSLGKVSCEALPLSYTDSIGGCDASLKESNAADEASSTPKVAPPIQNRVPDTVDARAAQRADDKLREQQRESCKDRYRDQIDQIEAEMRRGYSSQQGEVYRQRLRGLTQQMRKC